MFQGDARPVAVVRCSFGNAEADELPCLGYRSAQDAGNGLVATVMTRDEYALIPKNGASPALCLTHTRHVVALLSYCPDNSSSDAAQLDSPKKFVNSGLT
jgi:hypothetical protein